MLYCFTSCTWLDVLIIYPVDIAFLKVHVAYALLMVVMAMGMLVRVGVMMGIGNLVWAWACSRPRWR